MSPTAGTRDGVAEVAGLLPKLYPLGGSAAPSDGGAEPHLVCQERRPVARRGVWSVVDWWQARRRV